MNEDMKREGFENTSVPESDAADDICGIDGQEDITQAEHTDAVSSGPSFDSTEDGGPVLSDDENSSADDTAGQPERRFELIKNDELEKDRFQQVFTGFEQIETGEYNGNDTDFLSNYSQDSGTKAAKYDAMPKNHSRFLRFAGIFAAAAVFVMLIVLLSTVILVPKPSFEVKPGESASALPDASAGKQQILPEDSVNDKASAAVPDEGSSSSPYKKIGNLPMFGGDAPVITDKYNPVVEIVEQENDCVVSVQVDVVKEEAEGGSSVSGWIKGSGFIVTEDGYIITNYHVVSGGNNIKVKLTDDSEYSAAYIGGDSTIDIALIKIDAKGLPVVALGDSSNVKTGEVAIAIGNPAGMGDELTNTVTVGYVSSAQRTIQFNGYKQVFIQIDAPVNSGNSGGPVFNSKGEVIGIVTLKSLISSYDDYGTAIDSEGLGFAIPINTALDAIAQLFEYGAVRRPGIGIRYTMYDQEYAERKDVTSGMHVEKVEKGSSAEKAGIQEGDTIIRCDGIEIVTGDELVDLIKQKGIGSSVDLVIVRGDSEIKITVEIQDTNLLN
ncbi:MAG: trypsin-like peptidase domain-containing protein [Christensenellaceae bacterium]|nr:trypsin-like peptidase domain-containing protein [Christensenellaceae bacterium]